MKALLLCILNLIAAPPEEESGHRAYAEGRFEAAAQAYAQALTEPEADAGRLHFNLGNCAYRLGRHAAAVHHYRCARLRLPRDRELRFNLGLARQALGITPPPEESFGRAVLGLIDTLRPGEQLLLAGLVQGAGLLAFVLLRRRKGPRGVALLVVLLGLVTAGRLIQSRWFPAAPAGIVLSSTLNLRSKPHGEANVVHKLRAGAEVEVLETTDRWVAIASPQGRLWTERKGVGVIE